MRVQPPLANAVLDRVEPTTQAMRTQLGGKAVVNTLRSDAQRQAARGGRDQEAKAAAAGGRRKGGGKKRKQAAAQRRAPAEDSEDDFDSQAATGSEDDVDDGVGKDGPAAGAGKRPRKANPKYQS